MFGRGSGGYRAVGFNVQSNIEVAGHQSPSRTGRSAHDPMKGFRTQAQVELFQKPGDLLWDAAGYRLLPETLSPDQNRATGRKTYRVREGGFITGGGFEPRWRGMPRRNPLAISAVFRSESSQSLGVNMLHDSDWVDATSHIMATYGGTRIRPSGNVFGGASKDRRW